MHPTTYPIGINRILFRIQPHVLFRIGMVLFILLVLVQVGCFVYVGEVPSFILINNIATILAGLFAVLGMAFGAWWSYHFDRRLGSSWILFMIAMIHWVLGDILWAYNELVLGEVPSPFIGDVFYFLAYPLFLIGVIWLARLQETSRNTNWIWLDLIIVFFLSLGLYWNFLIGPQWKQMEHTGWLPTLVATAYPIGDLILVLIITLIVLLPHSPTLSPALYWMLSGHLITAVADSIYNYQVINGAYQSDAWFNILFSIGPLLLMLSGISQASSIKTMKMKRETSSFPNVSILPQVLVPAFWLSLAYFLLIYSKDAKQAMSESTFSLWLFIMIVFLVFRQFIAIKENEKLEKKLRHGNELLEKRVAERTSDLIRKNSELELEMEVRQKAEFMLREREENLAYMVQHDSLTGLPNRVQLFDRISQAIHNQKSTKKPYAVLFIDLDNFKIVNDSLGHPAGDQLLVDAGQRLSALVRSGDLVSRVGGDEFIVLLEGFEDETFVSNVVDRIQIALKKPHYIKDRPIYITASMGVVIMEANQPSDVTAADVIRDADIAMYSAKNDGKARHIVFRSNLHDRPLYHLETLTDLHQALEQNQFVLYYQPVLQLKTQKLVAFEALIRWQHPTRGLLSPDDFIPIAESDGFIDSISEWVLVNACQQLRKWHEAFPCHATLSINVNMSPQCLHRPKLATWVQEVLRNNLLPPTSLTLEIVETALIQNVEQAKQIFSSLRAMGVRVGLDDFGVGYSSLGYINEYPIDKIKIDQSFINRVSDNPRVAAVVRSIGLLSKELKVDLVAEGVETREQLEFLKELDCEYGQGFLFAKPLSVEEADAFLSINIEDAPPQDFPQVLKSQ